MGRAGGTTSPVPFAFQRKPMPTKTTTVKDFKPLIEELESAGFQQIEGKSHHKWQHPDTHELLVLPSSKTNPRMVNNLKLQVRRIVARHKPKMSEPLCVRRV